MAIIAGILFIGTIILACIALFSITEMVFESVGKPDNHKCDNCDFNLFLEENGYPCYFCRRNKHFKDCWKPKKGGK